jgi:hypothetical protein
MALFQNTLRLLAFNIWYTTEKIKNLYMVADVEEVLYIVRYRLNIYRNNMFTLACYPFIQYTLTRDSIFSVYTSV